MKELSVNLEYIKHNLNVLKKEIGNKVAICATVKADAYGHGLIPISSLLEKEKVNFLGITKVEEANILRKNKIQTPLLLFVPDPKRVKEIVSMDIISFVGDLNYLKKIEEESKSQGKQTKVHLKLDTGMNRFGSFREEFLEMAEYTNKSPSLILDGMCSHFSESEFYPPTKRSKAQIKKFDEVKQYLEKKGIKANYYHIANSDAIINIPESHYNLVRPGCYLYGIATDPYKIGLKPALSLKSTISFLKKVTKGSELSYNSIYKTEKDCQIAIVPLGYSDGLDIFFQERGAKVYIKNKFFPVVGKVCMNVFLVEIPLEENMEEGEEVELIGEHQDIFDFANYYPHESSYEAICQLGCFKPKNYL